MIQIKWLENRKMQLLFLLIITLIIILLPTIIRILHFKEIILPGDAIYYDIRIAEDIHSNNLLANDELVFTQTNYLFNPIHYLYMLFFIIMPPNIAIFLLTLFFSLFSIYLLYKIMETLAIEDNYKIITLILYILSPIFISSTIFISKFTLGILLFLLLVYLVILNKNSIIINVAIISLAILLFYISFPFLLFTIIFLFFYSILAKTSIKKPIIICAIIISIILLLHQIPISKQFTQLPERTIYSNIFQETISDLGSIIGFGIFSLLLFSVGLYVLWKKSYITKRQMMLIFVMLIITYYFSEGKYLLNILVCIIAATAFIYLLEKQWELSLIKEISLFILILGVIFSGLSTVARITIVSPSLNEYNAVRFLQQQYNNQDINSKGYVLSYYKYGHILQSIPGNNNNNNKIPVFLDTRSYESSNYFDQFTIANEIFYSRDIRKTTQLLSQSQIKYIFITPAMKSGLVWKKENQGLLFLLKNSERFKNIYNNNSIEIWEFS
ncbi:hypothetical protein HZA96_04580 [Candidatus Woesearchaeota archaeon]|nr:hypothetical protein [Candidatus Woesearchaeota archaeon]